MAEAAAPPPHDHFPPPEFTQPTKVSAQLITPHHYPTTYLLPAGHDGAGGGKAEAVPDRFHPLTDAPPPQFARMIHAPRNHNNARPGVQTALTAMHRRQAAQNVKVGGQYHFPARKLPPSLSLPTIAIQGRERRHSTESSPRNSPRSPRGTIPSPQPAEDGSAAQVLKVEEKPPQPPPVSSQQPEDKTLIPLHGPLPPPPPAHARPRRLSNGALTFPRGRPTSRSKIIKPLQLVDFHVRAKEGTTKEGGKDNNPLPPILSQQQELQPSLAYSSFVRRPLVQSGNPIDAARKIPAIPPAGLGQSSSAPILKGVSFADAAKGAAFTVFAGNAAEKTKAVEERTTDTPSPPRSANVHGIPPPPVTTSRLNSHGKLTSHSRASGSLWAMKRGATGLTVQQRMMQEARRRIKVQEAQSPNTSPLGRRPLGGGSKRGQKEKSKKKSGAVNFGSVVASLMRNRKAVEALKRCPVFSGLDDVQLAMLAYGGQPATLKRYAVLFRAGATSSAFYILMKGSLQSTIDDGVDNERTMITLEKDEKMRTHGVCFGLESLNNTVTRQATVSAIEPSEVLTFSTKDLHLDRSGIEKLAERVFAEVAEEALRNTPLFGGLDIIPLADLASMFVLQTVDPDTCIYEEGDKPEAVYILLNGSIEVSKDGQELAILDGAVGDSDESGHPYFGAEAVLEGCSRRPWDAFARTPCNLMVIDIKEFKRFLRVERDFRQELCEFTVTRIRQWELETGMPLPIRDPNHDMEESPDRRGSVVAPRRSSVAPGGRKSKEG